jgi:hypothetical protein
MRTLWRCGRLLLVGFASWLVAACAETRLQPYAPPPLATAPVLRASLGERLEPERLELAALDDAALERARGGLRVNGLDLSIGLQLQTMLDGLMQLTSHLTMTDTGQWIATASRATTSPAAVAAAPGAAGASGVSIRVVEAGGTGAAPEASRPPLPAAAGAARGVGTGEFRATLGDPATTHIVHQLMANSISSVITNRVDGARVDHTVQLNVGINNLAQFSARIATATRVNRLSRDISRFSVR